MTVPNSIGYYIFIDIEVVRAREGFHLWPFYTCSFKLVMVKKNSVNLGAV